MHSFIIRIATVLILVLPFRVAGQEPEIPDGFVLSPLMRSTHFVRDIDESLKLYRDILGLRPYLEITLSGDQVGTLLGTKDESVRAVLLQSGDLVFANIGLFQILDASSYSAVKRKDYLETGDTAVAFLTTDIFGIYNKIKDSGYSTISPPLVVFPKEGALTQSYEVMFFDRDGIGINLIQRDVPN